MGLCVYSPGNLLALTEPPSTSCPLSMRPRCTPGGCEAGLNEINFRVYVEHSLARREFRMAPLAVNAYYLRFRIRR